MRLNEIEQHTPHLYLDMDGVQADFFTAWAQLSGKQRYKEIGDRAQREASISDLNSRGPEFVEAFFTNLPVLPGAHELINFLQTNKIAYTVLSAPLRGNEEASIRGKIAWLNRHHPGTAGTAIFTGEKQRYAVTNGQPNVLVDDFKKYINAWVNSGGQGILYRWNNVSSAIAELKKIYGIDQDTTESTVLRGTDRIDVFLKGKHQGETITRPLARNFPNHRLDDLIRYLVDQYNVNPNAIVYGPSRSGETFESLDEAKVGYIYPPDIVGMLHIGDFTIPVHRHSLARASVRRVSTTAVDNALRSIPKVGDQVRTQEPGNKFWIYDPNNEISLGMLMLDSGRIQLNTVLPHAPHQQGLQTIIKLPVKTTENFANGRKFVGPNFDVEWEEAERYPEFVKLGKDAWIELARKGRAVTINSAQGISNTDAGEPDSFKSLHPAKQKRALAQLEKGTVEMPIVAVYSDGHKELIGGNTRLTAMMARDGRATVWAFRVPDNILENFADGKKPGRKGLTKRVGVNCKQPVSKLRSIAKNSSGERQRMAHWCANMKSGRQRSNEAEMPYKDAVDAGAMPVVGMTRNIVQDLQDKIEQLSNQAHALRNEIKRTQAAQASIPVDARDIQIKPNAAWTARDAQGRSMAGGAVGRAKK